MNHYTDKVGYNGIRATPVWRFVAAQPPDPKNHPFGAYFTTLSPDTKNLAIRLGIPRAKIEYLFSLDDTGDLTPLNNDRGEFIFYSPSDYLVEKDRQVYQGKAEEA